MTDVTTPAQVASAALKAAADTKSQTTTSSGTKRKRGNDLKFYAVRTGHMPGIYHSWEDCKLQITGFKKSACWLPFLLIALLLMGSWKEYSMLIRIGDIVKSFTSLTEAEAFMKADDSNPSSTIANPSKFYAVQNGRVPGVYTSWPDAQKQITGWTKPVHRKFTTKAEAYAFVQAGKADNSALAGVATSTIAEDNTSSSQPASKKAKKNNAKNETPIPEKDANGDPNPMFAPLPPDAEDGFDRNVILDPETGVMRHKTAEELAARKKMFKPDNYADSLRVWTDGACRGNGKKGAYGGVGVYFGEKDPRNVGEPLPGPRQTNQRAELTALKRALDITPLNRNVIITTDSKYSIDCVTKWCAAWKRNNWINSMRKPVENRDVIEKVLDMVEERERGGCQTQFLWVKGHGDDPGNCAADRLAVEGAEEGRRLRELLGAEMDLDDRNGEGRSYDRTGTTGTGESATSCERAKMVA
ncbi:ribonuclease H-like protein [Tothia fuscella]|uniref:ribonuclease H n=1 Tax=Tothia fuscella TaxID=1048955 RepID=A0A9P4NMV5_9PEZI|nr:ribonuclease H-like protein [Tothia fuscella]